MIQPVVPIRRGASHLVLAGIIAIASVIPAYAAGSSMLSIGTEAGRRHNSVKPVEVKRKGHKVKVSTNAD